MVKSVVLFWHSIADISGMTDSVPLSISTDTAAHSFIVNIQVSVCPNGSLTMVTLCPRPPPVPPSPLGSVSVSLDHCSYESSIADWK